MGHHTLHEDDYPAAPQLISFMWSRGEADVNCNTVNAGYLFFGETWGGFNRANSSMLANVVSLLTWNSTRPRKDDLWPQNSELSSDSQQDNSFQNCCILWKLLLNVSPHVYGMQRLLNLPAPNQNRSEPSLFWLLKSLVQRIRRNALIKLGQQMMFN